MSEPIELKSCTLHLDAEGILHLKLRPNAKVKLDDAKEIIKAVHNLSGGRKVLELMEGGSFFTFDEAAQKHAAQHGGKYFIASAIVLKSRGMITLFNFFKIFFPQPVPFRMFSSREAALKWLRKFR